jgi:aryl-alcohol dehydrogenase-like predicted oxidoreductase
MEQRVLGRTGRPASVVGLGTWQLGADWGNVSEDDAMQVLRAAVESGVTFFDTADVYGDGRSERIIGRFGAGNAGQHVMVATKMGRGVEQIAEHYTLENFRAWTDRSRVNLGTDRLDLVQLHCPPTAVFASDAVFDALDTLVTEERIAAYGVSVETCDQALTAIARRGVHAAPARPSRTRKPPACRRCRRPASTRSKGCTTGTSARRCTAAGERDLIPGASGSCGRALLRGRRSQGRRSQGIPSLRW